MTRIRYISGARQMRSIGSLDPAAEAALAEYVQIEQYNFYRNALSYAIADTVILEGAYGSGTVATIAQATELQPEVSYELGLIKARQDALKASGGIDYSLGMDPLMAPIISSGTIAGPRVGLVPIAIGYMIAAAVLIYVTMELIELIFYSNDEAKKTLKITDGLAPIFDKMTPADRATAVSEIDKQLNAAYRAGGTNSLFSGFSGTAISALALGAGGLILYKQLTKPSTGR